MQLDRARRVFREPDGEPSCDWGLGHEEEGECLDPGLLARLGDSIVAEPSPPPQSLASPMLEAMRLAELLAAVVDACGDPSRIDRPSSNALAAIRRLASVALTVSCTRVSSLNGGPHASRVWRMREVAVHAGGQGRWDAPGQANWTDYFRYVITGTTDVIEACLDCSWAPVTVWPAGDDLFHHDPDEHRETAAGSLVSTCLATLALFTPAT